MSNSVAKCWLSAAEPPLPQNISLPPARRLVSQASTTRTTVSANSTAIFCFSSADRRIMAANRSVSIMPAVLLRRPTAVDGKRCAGDRLRAFRAQENRKGADLLGRRELLHRLLFGQEPVLLRLKIDAVLLRPGF